GPERLGEGEHGGGVVGAAERGPGGAREGARAGGGGVAGHLERREAGAREGQAQAGVVARDLALDVAAGGGLVDDPDEAGARGGARGRGLVRRRGGADGHGAF